MLLHPWFVVSIIAALAAPHADRALSASVDPRVELMSVIFRLAGHPEYNQPNSKSPYADAVEAHFGPHRGHAVVEMARDLRRERGISYDAVMSLAVHVTEPPQLQERIPFDRSPSRLDRRWRSDEARAFLEQARDFVRQADFDAFWQEHGRLREVAGRRLTQELNRRHYIEWFDRFFGARPGAAFRVYVGLLNGGANYGVGVRFPDGREEITPVIGAWKWDAAGRPEFDDSMIGTIVHEFCHSYTNPFVDKYEQQLESAGKSMYAHCRERMERMAYGTWQTMMYESLVRACVVRYLEHDGGSLAAAHQIEQEEARGFRWIGQLAELIESYEKNRGRYEDFDAFMPRVIAFFNEYAREYDKEMAAAPHVVSVTPADGATVDPDVSEIVIRFDQPMLDGSWSVCGGGTNFPQVVGTPRYDAECRVLRVPVRLKPNWTYQFAVNCPSAMGFKNRDGVPVEPVYVTFQTRAP